MESASSAAFQDDQEAAFQYIQKAFRCKISDESRRVISRNPWRRAYTANYDDTLELALHESQAPYTILDVDDDPSDPIKGSVQIVHIHGAISKLTAEHFKRVFYLTDEQSRDIAFDRSVWRRYFLQDLTYCDAAFFVGFSNSDFHIRRILDSVRHLSSKIFFITGNKLSAPARQRIASYGQYHPIGVDGFAKLISETPESDQSDVTTPHSFIEKNYPRNTVDIVTRDEVYKELLLGTIDQLNFGRAGVGGYYFDRISARGADKIYTSNGAFVFFSDVGNGKTTLVNQIAAACFRRGRKVFQYVGGRVDIEGARRFVEMLDAPVFIVENISLNFDIVKLIQDCNNKAIILCTERTKRLEITTPDLKAKEISIKKIDANKLSNIEVNSLIEFLDHNILWGDSLTSQTREAKISHIQKRCAQELRGVLFSLFEGGSVHARINSIFEQFSQLDKDLHDIIVLSSVLNYAYTKNPLDHLLFNLEDFLDIRLEYERSRSEVEEKEIFEFISFDNGIVGFKSSVFAKYYLNKMVDIDYVLELMFLVMRNLERSYKKFDSEVYYDFSKALMQYNLYREIYSRNSARDARLALSREKFDAAIEKFYDKCRVLQISIANPLFIIQISMASMDRGEFDSCEDLIASARSIARTGFDQYHIDTHHAEVLIRKSMKQGISKELERERKSFNLLREVIERRNERYHPFGVLDKLISLFEEKVHDISVSERTEIAGMLSGMRKLAMRFPSEVKDKYHIVMRVDQRAEKLHSKIVARMI